MNNEGLKSESFEDKKVENNQESLLWAKISESEKQKNEWKEKFLKLEEMYKKLKHDLIHDPLTGLKTRKYFEERAEEIISYLKNPEQEKREEGFRSFSVVFCDIDNFKTINDTLGHDGGDEILKKVSEIISGNVRNSDIVSRWGGDEIVVGLFGADENEAVEKAEQIRIAIKEGMRKENVTLSIGVSYYKDGQDVDSLIKQGDEAMYLAKKSGKNNVKSYTDFLNASKK